MSELLPFRRLDEVSASRSPARLDDELLREAAILVDRVRQGGADELRTLRERFDGIPRDAPLFIGRAALRDALSALDAPERERLQRIASRIEVFATAQRAACTSLEQVVDGVACGHDWLPVGRAGCYAPGGRYPLPSSVLMTAIPARVAGVERVVVACPRDDRWIRAAAAVAGADELLHAGGAHAVAALAHGVEGRPGADVIAGPGNRWVTAAKQLVSVDVGIDLLAGPSEVVVAAGPDADPAAIASELIAQAEHGVDAWPVLVTTERGLVARVRTALDQQLEDLSTAATARTALEGGAAVVVDDDDAAVDAVDLIAPEHLQLHGTLAARERYRQAGGIFVGGDTPVALGDYGAGPNHTLPTAGAARHRAGLSVSHFLRARTWVEVRDPAASRRLHEDAAWLARIEGLEGHARAVERAKPRKMG